MALGATSCTQAIQEAYQHSDILKTFFHGHSFTGNPLACAAANASYQILTTETCQQDIIRVGSKLSGFCEKLSGHHLIQEVRQIGAILALELKSQEDTSYVNEARHRLYPFFIERGVLLRPLGNILYVIPPYIITDEELETVYGAIEELLMEANWLT